MYQTKAGSLSEGDIETGWKDIKASFITDSPVLDADAHATIKVGYYSGVFHGVMQVRLAVEHWPTTYESKLSRVETLNRIVKQGWDAIGPSFPGTEVQADIVSRMFTLGVHAGVVEALGRSIKLKPSAAAAMMKKFDKLMLRYLNKLYDETLQTHGSTSG